MASISYTLYDYANAPADLLDTFTVQAFSDVTLTISTNGAFPNEWVLNDEGEWEGGALDGALDVTIDGIHIGRLFAGPPGDDGLGYFVDSGGELPYGTAVIPPDVWRSIIADGQIQIAYGLGTDAESLAQPDDYIRVDIDWWESASQYTGSPFDDFMMTNGPALYLALGGNDTIVGSPYDDTIHGGDGNDSIDGGTGDDLVRGNTGDDVAAGGAGDDHVAGNEGDDALSGDAGNDQVRGGVGIDTLRGGEGDDFLWGGADRDLLFGDNGGDRLWGEAGNDDLDGGGGNDTLWGGEGDDRLIGGAGENHLFGGSGADQFVFTHSDGIATQRVYDFDRASGDRLVYVQAVDEVAGDVGIRVGKDGTVVTIADNTIVLSGVFDFTVADIDFFNDSDLLL